MTGKRRPRGKPSKKKKLGVTSSRLSMKKRMKVLCKFRKIQQLATNKIESVSELQAVPLEGSDDNQGGSHDFAELTSDPVILQSSTAHSSPEGTTTSLEPIVHTPSIDYPEYSSNEKKQNLIKHDTELRGIAAALDAVRALDSSVVSSSGLFDVFHDNISTLMYGAAEPANILLPDDKNNTSFMLAPMVNVGREEYACNVEQSSNYDEVSECDTFRTIKHSTPVKKLPSRLERNVSVETDLPSFDMSDIEIQLPASEEHEKNNMGNNSRAENEAVLSMQNRSVLDHSLIIEPEIHEPEVPQLLGRRIVDIGHLMKAIQSEKHAGGMGCNFLDMDFLKEVLDGFASVWKFKCRVCNIRSNITSEDLDNRLNYMPVNDAAVHGIVATGGGYAQLNEFTSALDIHCMSTSKYMKHFKAVSKAISDAAMTAMLEAASLEIAYAREEGNIDEDGVPMCTVVADGQWCKRSYKTNYDSLSGVASIVGFHTKKVLFIGVRNRYCSICVLYKHQAKTVPEHECFMNWSKSATSMEADIVAEGFSKSVELLGLKFNKLIGDGDSSVHKRLLDSKPYGPNLLVEKVECRNHVLRNYSNKLMELTKKKEFSVEGRKFLKENIIRFRTAVAKAIKHRSSEKVTLHQRVLFLKQDIENSPYHIFGQHSLCASYFCEGPKEGEFNRVPALAESGLLQAVVSLVRRSVSYHAHSLLQDKDNNASEQYNSVVNKFVGGKRINYALRGQYTTRCAAAVVSFNNTGQYLRMVHKSMMSDKSPGYHTKKFIQSKIRAHDTKNKRKLQYPETQRRKMKKGAGPDQHYGLVDTNVPSDDLSQEELASKMATFIAGLKTSEEERKNLERETVLQSSNPTWLSYRKKIITASWFGQVCHMKPTTSCRNTVHSMLYSNVRTKAMDHGIVTEPLAKALMKEQHGIIAEDCGLFIDSEYPFIGASPDGLVGEHAIVEVKCPLSAEGTESPEDAMANSKIKYCDLVDGKLLLKPHHNYFYQVQGQLHVTQRRQCYFIIYTDNWLNFEVIERDDDFWQTKMVDRLCWFYKECLLREICNPQYGKRFMKSDIVDPASTIEAQEAAKANKRVLSVTRMKNKQMEDK